MLCLRLKEAMELNSFLLSVMKKNAYSRLLLWCYHTYFFSFILKTENEDFRMRFKRVI